MLTKETHGFTARRLYGKDSPCREAKETPPLGRGGGHTFDKLSINKIDTFDKLSINMIDKKLENLILLKSLMSKYFNLFKRKP